MSGLKITIDDEGAAKLLIDLQGRASDLEPVMAAIAGEVDDRVQESFENKRSPADLSGWPELKPATIRARIRKGFNGTDVLQRTRILRTSVVTDVMSTGQGVETTDGAIEYALYHQLGAPKANIPARVFAGISPEDADEFEDMIAEFISAA